MTFEIIVVIINILAIIIVVAALLRDREKTNNVLRNLKVDVKADLSKVYENSMTTNKMIIDVYKFLKEWKEIQMAIPKDRFVETGDARPASTEFVPGPDGTASPITTAAGIDGDADAESEKEVPPVEPPLPAEVMRVAITEKIQKKSTKKPAKKITVTKLKANAKKAPADKRKAAKKIAKKMSGKK